MALPLTRTMLRLLPLRLAPAFVTSLMIAVGCSGTTVTNVGSITEDGGAGDGPSPPAEDASTGADASSEAAADAADAHEDASPTPCAAGACGARACGRDECGHTCGTCPGAPIQGGCFMGHCNASCPGTPCLDHNGEHVCEGERGGRTCTGGSLNIQVCTCTGGGANAWASCGACL
jgi:hypothetical protein